MEIALQKEFKSKRSKQSFTRKGYSILTQRQIHFHNMKGVKIKMCTSLGNVKGGEIAHHIIDKPGCHMTYNTFDALSMIGCKSRKLAILHMLTIYKWLDFFFF